MSEHIDFELTGDRRFRLTMAGDLLVPPDTDPRVLDWLLQPLALATHKGKAEAGYRFAEVDLYPVGSLPALRRVLDTKLPSIGLEGRTEPPLPPEEDVVQAGDTEQDVTFDA